MKKHPKILNFIIVLTLIFSTAIFTAVESFALKPQPAMAQSIQQTKQIDNKSEQASTIPGKNAYAITHMKKDGIKYGILKFLTAMLGVLISSLAIFLSLKLYKKFMLKSNTNIDNIDYNKTLESPKDLKEAINLFLDKTNK